MGLGQANGLFLGTRRIMISICIVIEIRGLSLVNTLYFGLQILKVRYITQLSGDSGGGQRIIE
jgi:hypothetical protein